VKRIKEENKQGLDLSTWRVAFNGAEPVRKETLEQFYQAFKAYGLHREALQPCYGLAESTLLVSTKTPGRLYNTMTLAKEQYQDHRVHFVEEDAPGSHSIVSSGHVVQTVKIVDPDTRLPCDNDQVGSKRKKQNMHFMAK
jgi:acyl-CoA synthetase (AMP-forming)/AMP-acid ligase II